MGQVVRERIGDAGGAAQAGDRGVDRHPLGEAKHLFTWAHGPFGAKPH